MRFITANKYIQDNTKFTALNFTITGLSQADLI